MNRFNQNMHAGETLAKFFARKRAGECPFCGKNMQVEANRQFRDRLSEKEFMQSGICQDCQDDFFNEE